MPAWRLALEAVRRGCGVETESARRVLREALTQRAPRPSRWVLYTVREAAAECPVSACGRRVVAFRETGVFATTTVCEGNVG